MEPTDPVDECCLWSFERLTRRYAAPIRNVRAVVHAHVVLKSPVVGQHAFHRHRRLEAGWLLHVSGAGNVEGSERAGGSRSGSDPTEPAQPMTAQTGAAPQPPGSFAPPGGRPLNSVLMKCVFR